MEQLPELVALEGRLASLCPRERVLFCEFLAGWLKGQATRSLVAVPSAAEKSVAASLAADLGCSTAAVVRRAEQAAELVALPAVLARVEAGTLGAAHAAAVASALAGVAPDLAADAAELVIDRVSAAEGPAALPRAYGEAARAVVDRFATDVALVRREKAYAARDVTVTALPDDMALLRATLRADDALRLMDLVHAQAAAPTPASALGGGAGYVAGHLARQRFDARTLGPTGYANRRADALLELLGLGPDAVVARPAGAGRRPAVVYVVHESTVADLPKAQQPAAAVTLPAAALLPVPAGLPVPAPLTAAARQPVPSRLPASASLPAPAAPAAAGVSPAVLTADLRGAGPVSATLARACAKQPDTLIRHLTVDPHGRLTTPPPASDPTARYANSALQRWLQLRDRTCRIPGCTVPASTCDIDHITKYADGGLTIPTNLWCLCSTHHHGLKHADSTRTTGDANTVVTLAPKTGPPIRSRPPTINPRTRWGS